MSACASGSEQRGNIVVLGGYGAVGRVACEVLGKRFPGQVLAAGRDLRKAETLSRKTKGRVLPLGLDVSNPGAFARVLGSARVVVACAGRDDEGLVRDCLDRGVHYVDISASRAYLERVERLDARAKERNATAVLSVGLAPGLTNLLAKRCKDSLDTVRSLDISVLIGMGEAHGKAAVRWTLENLDKRFMAPGSGGPREVVDSLEGPKATFFPGGYGRRTCYRFDFSDQHTVSRTLGVENIATRLCFDPAWSTRLLALMKRAGAFRLLKHSGVRDALVGLLGWFRLGSDGFAVKAEAEGTDGRRYACSVFGRGEGRATGTLAALVAESLYIPSSPKPGVFHIEELFAPEKFLGRVTDHGFSVVPDPPAPALENAPEG